MTVYPTPFRVEFPFGLPGDGFRAFAKPGKATCVAHYRGIHPKLLAGIAPGNELRYDTNDLADDMRRNGYKGGEGQEIIVYVDGTGSAKIGEGNHRLDAALKAGIDKVDVQVRYQNRSDEHHLLWPIDLTDRSIRIIAEERRTLRDFMRIVDGT